MIIFEQNYNKRMNFQVRKQKIIEKLEQDGIIDVKKIAPMLETSEITVRRDLAILAEQGLLVRTYGGAMKVSLSQMPVSFAQKSAINAEQKDEICRKAVAQIQEGDVVFLDCGSTVFRMCPFIRNLNIKVVTNSLPIINELIGSSVSLNFAGGEIDSERQAAHGKIAVEHFQRYRADKAFVGIDGISLKNGLSASSEKEAEITMAIAQNARETFFLCDSGKLEHDRYFPFAPIEFVRNLITDSRVSEGVVNGYRAFGVNIS
jgi:DeoR family transcriptional regulator, fructose operon transcriptional repressor